VKSENKKRTTKAAWIDTTHLRCRERFKFSAWYRAHCCPLPNLQNYISGTTIYIKFAYSFHYIYQKARWNGTILVSLSAGSSQTLFGTSYATGFMTPVLDPTLKCPTTDFFVTLALKRWHISILVAL
jgi:hypothetical protein